MTLVGDLPRIFHDSLPCIVHFEGADDPLPQNGPFSYLLSQIHVYSSPVIELQKGTQHFK